MRLSFLNRSLPIRLAVILEEFSPHVIPGVEARDDRVHYPRRAVHDVERGVELIVANLKGVGS